MRSARYFLVLISFIVFSTLPRVHGAYNYYIVPDYDNGYAIPVNIETTLSITVYSSTTNNPVAGIPVTITPQWESPIVKYSDSNGKVNFIVKPTSKGNFTITYSSPEGYFATVVTYISAKPAVLIDAEYNSVQYMDPIDENDIVIYMRAESSEDFSIITNPLWEVLEIRSEGTTLTPSITYRIESETDKYKLIVAVTPRSSSTVGTYYITVQGSSSDLLPKPYTFKVVLRLPAIFLHYKFATGEEIILAPHESGTGIDVKRGCPYFDIYFYDSRGHPIIVSFTYNTDMFKIVGQAGGIYTLADYDFTYEWYIDDQKSEEGVGNRLRIYFTLIETYYSLIPYIQATIGGYPTTCQTELIVATVRKGFNIFDFITNVYIMIPLALLIVVIIFKLLGRVKKK